MTETKKYTKESKCTKRCATCKHHTFLSSGQNFLACGYILDTRKRRGCPAGDECDKYEKGVARRSF